MLRLDCRGFEDLQFCQLQLFKQKIPNPRSQKAGLKMKFKKYMNLWIICASVLFDTWVLFFSGFAA